MSKSPLLVIGGVALDITSTLGKSLNVLYTSTPGRVRHSLGGVGRNVAEAAMRTGANVKLVSVVGNDLAGESVLEGMKQLRMETEYIQSLPEHSTAVYNAIHTDKGELLTAVADMGIFDAMKPSTIGDILRREKPSLVCFDGNIPSDVMKHIAVVCESLSTPVFFEPTSVPKSLKLFDHPETVQHQRIRYVSPNQYELEAMYEHLKLHPQLGLMKTLPRPVPVLKNVPKLVESVLPNAFFLSNHIPTVITKLGEEGCLYVSGSVVEYFPPEQIESNKIKSVTGAGDCFVGTLIANVQQHSNVSMGKMREMIHQSQKASIRTIQSEYAVSPYIGDDLLVT